MRQDVPRATIRTVAALAGVTVGTASKALNNKGQLRQETRDRVLAAAAQLNFKRNEMARSLGSARTFAVGLISTDSFGRFSIPVLMGAEDALQEGQMTVFLCDTRDDPIRERHYVEILLGRRVDGLIVTGRRSNPRPPIAPDLRLPPVVYALTPSSDASDCSVVVNDKQAGRLAAQHLVATGRTSIAHITGPERFDAVQKRLSGLLQVLTSHRLRIAGPGALHGEWSEAWGRQAVHVLLQSRTTFDAIYCASDQLARGAAEALRDAGYRLPDDVALVGTDNWDIMATGRLPTLTTIDMNLHDIGRVAAGYLLDAIEGKPKHGVDIRPCELVVRESTERPGTIGTRNVTSGVALHSGLPRS